jgi:hypothetical protein
VAQVVEHLLCKHSNSSPTRKENRVLGHILLSSPIWEPFSGEARSVYLYIRECLCLLNESKRDSEAVWMSSTVSFFFVVVFSFLVQWIEPELYH